MKLKTGKRFRKARRFTEYRYAKHIRRVRRIGSDHWAAVAPVGHLPCPGRLIPISKAARR